MAYFTNARGDQFAINFTIGSVIDVHNKVGVNLLDVASTDYPEGDKSPLPLSTRLFVDDFFLARIVYAMVDTDLKLDDFADRLDGAAVKRMSDAFFEEYERFFVERGATAAAKSIQMQKVQWAKITADELKRLESIGSGNLQGAPGSDSTTSDG